MSRSPALTLASGSPRRRELLARLRPDFRVLPSEIDESLPARVTPDAVAAVALAKARAVAGRVAAGVVLGADTVVVLDGAALGKPAGPAEAVAMLRRLRGRAHDVITGVAVIEVASGREAAGAVVTRVLMDDYPDDVIHAYVASGAPLDKAGAYGVQDLDGRLVAGWIGSYSNIVGLPLAFTGALLDDVARDAPPARARRGPGPGAAGGRPAGA